jgi:hypothetical protein
MRAQTEGKNEMGKRFAIVIGVAAAGVMALGAQTAAAAPDVVKYDTTLFLTKDGGSNYHGSVESEVRKCMEGRRVVVFKLRPGADRKLGTERSDLEPSDLSDPGSDPLGYWWLNVDRDYDTRVRAKVTRKVGDRYVCRADRAAYSR